MRITSREHAPDALQLATVDVAAEARKAAEFVQVIADERGVAIVVDG